MQSSEVLRVEGGLVTSTASALVCAVPETRLELFDTLSANIRLIRTTHTSELLESLARPHELRQSTAPVPLLLLEETAKDVRRVGLRLERGPRTPQLLAQLDELGRMHSGLLKASNHVRALARIAPSVALQFHAIAPSALRGDERD